MSKSPKTYRIWDGGSGISYSTFCEIVEGDLANLSDLTADLIDAEEIYKKIMEDAKAAYESALKSYEDTRSNLAATFLHTQKKFPAVADKGIRFHEKDVVYELRMKDETTVAWDKKEITINHRGVN